MYGVSVPKESAVGHRMSDNDDIDLPEVVRRLIRVEAEVERVGILGGRNEKGVAFLRSQGKYLREEVGKCVTKSDFTPVQRVVYGIVGLILVAVVTALLGITLKGHP